MTESPFDPHAARLFVFDFDGVVVESADIKTEAFEALFSDYPRHLDKILEYHLRNEGVSRFEKFEWIHNKLLGVPLTPEQAQQLGDRFSELVMQRVLEAPHVPGALELLEFLSDSGIPAAVASGTPEEELTQIVSDRGLSRYFAAVHGSPMTKPDILRSLSNAWGLRPEEIIMVGDAGTDFKAAQDAGTQFFARERPDSDAPWRGSMAATGADLNELLDRLQPAPG